MPRVKPVARRLSSRAAPPPSPTEEKNPMDTPRRSPRKNDQPVVNPASPRRSPRKQSEKVVPLRTSPRRKVGESSKRKRSVRDTGSVIEHVNGKSELISSSSGKKRKRDMNVQSPKKKAKVVEVLLDVVEDIPCMVCKDKGEAEKMVLCDGCNAGCHIFCMRPVRMSIPLGVWMCPTCYMAAERHGIHLSMIYKYRAEKLCIKCTMGVGDRECERCSMWLHAGCKGTDVCEVCIKEEGEDMVYVRRNTPSLKGEAADDEVEKNGKKKKKATPRRKRPENVADDQVWVNIERRGRDDDFVVVREEGKRVERDSEETINLPVGEVAERDERRGEDGEEGKGSVEKREEIRQDGDGNEAAVAQGGREGVTEDPSITQSLGEGIVAGEQNETEEPASENDVANSKPIQDDEGAEQSLRTVEESVVHVDRQHDIEHAQHPIQEQNAEVQEQNAGIDVDEDDGVHRNETAAKDTERPKDEATANAAQKPVAPVDPPMSVVQTHKSATSASAEQMSKAPQPTPQPQKLAEEQQQVQVEMIEIHDDDLVNADKQPPEQPQPTSQTEDVIMLDLHEAEPEEPKHEDMQMKNVKRDESGDVEMVAMDEVVVIDSDDEHEGQKDAKAAENHQEKEVEGFADKETLVTVGTAERRRDESREMEQVEAAVKEKAEGGSPEEKGKVDHKEAAQFETVEDGVEKSLVSDDRHVAQEGKQGGQEASNDDAREPAQNTSSREERQVSADQGHKRVESDRRVGEPDVDLVGDHEDLIQWRAMGDEEQTEGSSTMKDSGREEDTQRAVNKFAERATGANADAERRSDVATAQEQPQAEVVVDSAARDNDREISGDHSAKQMQEDVQEDRLNVTAWGEEVDISDPDFEPEAEQSAEERRDAEAKVTAEGEEDTDIHFEGSPITEFRHVPDEDIGIASRDEGKGGNNFAAGITKSLVPASREVVQDSGFEISKEQESDGRDNGDPGSPSEESLPEDEQEKFETEQRQDQTPSGEGENKVAGASKSAEEDASIDGKQPGNVAQGVSADPETNRSDMMPSQGAATLPKTLEPSFVKAGPIQSWVLLNVNPERPFYATMFVDMNKVSYFDDAVRILYASSTGVRAVAFSKTKCDCTDLERLKEWWVANRDHFVNAPQQFPSEELLLDIRS